jgi:predicted nucleic acid-binding protein
MIAVDTNVLVYAHREDSQWHPQAYARIIGLADFRHFFESRLFLF